MNYADNDQHPHRRDTYLGRIAAEPVAQFLLIGILLFGANYYLRGSDTSYDDKRIILTTNDIRQLSMTWLAQGRPAPTPEQLKGLVDQKVAMEILAREAKNVGLDQNDEVIKRRLAQKMDFLFDDVGRAREPTEAELRDWFAKNAAQFADPPRIEFRHLYYALDRGHTMQQVAALKAQMANMGEGDNAVRLAAADPFMFADTYRDATPEQIAKIFGPDFSDALFALPQSSDWQGPIKSGYGLHLVQVDALTPAATAAFDDVKPQVEEAWLNDQTRQLKQKAFQELKARYTVMLPPLDDPGLVLPSTTETITQ